MLRKWGNYALIIAIAVLLECGFLYPSAIVYTVPAAVAAGCMLAFAVKKNAHVSVWVDRIAVLLFVAGLSGWLLWVDYAFLKYAFPLFGAGLLWHGYGDTTARFGVLSAHARLSLFFANTFFWATIGYGVVSILGWQLWYGTVFFLLPLYFSGKAAFVSIEKQPHAQHIALLVLLSISAQAFIVLLWLPFNETTNALLATLVSLFVFDMLKYFLAPSLVRRKIVRRKILAYAAICLLVLISTPWY